MVITGFVSLLILNCGYSDTRNLPNTIKVKAVTSAGYHVHAKVEFYASNPIKFICTGIFGEGLNGKTDTYNNISQSGVEFVIKKKWDGLCNYQFTYLEVACTKTQSFPYSHDNSFQSISIGILDTSEDAQSRRGNTIHSGNKISDNALYIKVNGDKSNFWGCKDDCENEEDFGINRLNETLNINCQDEQ